METHKQNCTRTASHHDLSLDVLLVSRQLYQEMALQPFRQTLFSRLDQRHDILPAFLGSLVPAQAKAITRMRQIRAAGYVVFSPPQLRGLKHLDILILHCIRHKHTSYDERIPEVRLRPREISAIKKLGLQSIRLGVEIRGWHESAEEDHQLVRASSDSMFQTLKDLQILLLGRQM
jgi:hypothetical protein